MTFLTFNSTILNSSDNIPSYLPDNHHSSCDVYCRKGATKGFCAADNSSFSNLQNLSY